MEGADEEVTARKVAHQQSNRKGKSNEKHRKLLRMPPPHCFGKWLPVYRRKSRETTAKSVMIVPCVPEIQIVQ